MLSHVVLFRPKPDLSADDAQRFVVALERALTSVPSVRRATVGRRARIGAQYEQLPQPDFPYIAVIEFDDRAGLEAYLGHPAHDELSQRFWASLEATQIYDFEMEDSASGLRALLGGAAL
ncbi:MAG: Dabb family protein [Vicinamibacterales bacterium]